MTTKGSDCCLTSVFLQGDVALNLVRLLQTKTSNIFGLDSTVSSCLLNESYTFKLLFSMCKTIMKAAESKNLSLNSNDQLMYVNYEQHSYFIVINV